MSPCRRLASKCNVAVQRATNACHKTYRVFFKGLINKELTLCYVIPDTFEKHKKVFNMWRCKMKRKMFSLNPVNVKVFFLQNKTKTFHTSGAKVSWGRLWVVSGMITIYHNFARPSTWSELYPTAFSFRLGFFQTHSCTVSLLTITYQLIHC